MTRTKWGDSPNSRTVAFFHRRIGEAYAERLSAAGKSWQQGFGDPAVELSKEDFAAIEAEFLAQGELFESSAGISVRETPEKYKELVTSAAEVEIELDDEGRANVGSGDNVFATPANVTGIARFITGVDRVMEMLTEGVPPDTVAIIDDSGGTLTAPILEEFTAVVCKGGSVRSHMGILTREYGIPCLMDARVTALNEGDRVLIEYSSPAKSPYEDDGLRARIWKLP